MGFNIYEAEIEFINGKKERVKHRGIWEDKKDLVIQLPQGGMWANQDESNLIRYPLCNIKKYRKQTSSGCLEYRG